MDLRRLAAGATTVLVGVTIAPLPADAQDTRPLASLSIRLSGTTIAAGAPGKLVTIEVINHGPEEMSDQQLQYRLSALDASKVRLVLEGCRVEGESGMAFCDIDRHLRRFERMRIRPFLEVIPGATGEAGEFDVAVGCDCGDGDETDNAVIAPVQIAGSGPDLLVDVPEVDHAARLDPEPEVLDSPLVPGSDAIVEVFVKNQGDQVASGIGLSIRLSEHVTFARRDSDCTHAPGDRLTTCAFPQLSLQPAMATDPEEECDWTGSCGWLAIPVTLSDDAPSPALPFGRNGVEALPLEGADVSPSDNRVDFNVFVSEAPEPPDRGGDDGDDGRGGELPKTGAPVAPLGWGGLGLLAVGLALFLLSRRAPIRGARSRGA